MKDHRKPGGNGDGRQAHDSVAAARMLPPPPRLACGRRLADRVRGMMLGLAVGDALGNTSEGLLPARRAALCGEIRDYLPNRHAQRWRIGLPSDDTQLAFWTLEHLLAGGGVLSPERLGRLFASRRIFGMGGTVRASLARQAEGGPWTAWGVPSAGNGALMRIAPVLIPHLAAAPSPRLWGDAADCAALTHRDAAAVSSAVAFVGILWALLGMEALPAPQWWVSAYLERARPLEGGGTRYAVRGGPLVGWEGPLWRFVQTHVPQALAAGVAVRAACDGWYSGAYLLETVPSVLYILARHGHDPEEAIVRAVNDTKDNDTIAAIVGAAVGALHGASALPRRWVEGLAGRTRADDDGAVFRLLDAAEEAFLGGAVRGA